MVNNYCFDLKLGSRLIGVSSTGKGDDRTIDSK